MTEGPHPSPMVKGEITKSCNSPEEIKNYILTKHGTKKFFLDQGKFRIAQIKSTPFSEEMIMITWWDREYSASIGDSYIRTTRPISTDPGKKSILHDKGQLIMSRSKENGKFDEKHSRWPLICFGIIWCWTAGTINIESFDHLSNKIWPISLKLSCLSKIDLS